MSELRRRMIDDMKLKGLALRTQESYVAAVKARRSWSLSKHPWHFSNTAVALSNKPSFAMEALFQKTTPEFT